MEETKDSGQPLSHKVANTLKQHYAGTFVAQRERAQQNSIGQTSEPDEHREEELIPMELKRALAWFNGLKHDAITALFTIGIFFATTVYAGMAIAQWCAMRESNEINRDALQSVQRAFVIAPKFSDMMKISQSFPVERKLPELRGFQFGFAWENVGNTPTKDLVLHVNRQDGKVPRDFTFPDFDGEGVKSTIGPKGTTTSKVQPLFPRELELLRDGKLTITYWGRALYNDRFPNTARHVTEFCYEVRGILGDCLNPSTPECRLQTFQCVQHFCADEECKADR